MKRKHCFGNIVLATLLLFGETAKIDIHAEGRMVAGGVHVSAETCNGTITTIEYDLQYVQSDARNMLGNINAFRTGSEAWYWNADNATKKTFSGLSTLQYDANLEAIAMQRASEIAISFAHQRPNDMAWNSYRSNGIRTNGENIAFGTGMTMAKAFKAWKEADKDYAGQGHRRNMLEPRFNSIGIAHAKIGNMDYWVQEFGVGSSSSSQGTYDGIRTVNVEVLNANVVSYNSLSAETSSFELNVGQTSVAPTVYAQKLVLTGTYPQLAKYRYTPQKVAVICTWVSENANIATVQNGMIYAKSPGRVKLRTFAFGNEVTIDVSVNGNTTSISGNGAELSDSSAGLTDGSESSLNELLGSGQTGWKYSNGKWYYKENGVVTTGWVMVGDEHYYMDCRGVMQTGWILIDQSWYYMKSSGAMATGWLFSGGKWYYMDRNNGVMDTGWLRDGNTWYFMHGDGSMTVGWAKSGNDWYYMKSSGAMATGWVCSGGKWYYMTGSGAMATGWVKSGNSWYYMYSNGVMASDCRIGNYYVGSDGAWVPGR